MKRILLLLAFSTFLAGLAGAQNPGLQSPIAFDIDLEDLHQAAMTGDDSGIPRNRLLIIEGDIGSRDILEDAGDRFRGELELVGGHWEGEDRIELYRASIIFEGPEYRELFSSRSEDRFKNGEKLIVVAVYVDLDQDYISDGLIPVLKSLAWRRIR